MVQCLTQAQCLTCAFLFPCGGEETSLVAAFMVPNKTKKKKKSMKIATIYNATPPQCRQWSNQMLFPGGALLADRDGLKTEVMVSGRFLRRRVI